MDPAVYLLRNRFLTRYDDSRNIEEPMCVLSDDSRRGPSTAARLAVLRCMCTEFHADRCYNK